MTTESGIVACYCSTYMSHPPFDDRKVFSVSSTGSFVSPMAWAILSLSVYIDLAVVLVAL